MRRFGFLVAVIGALIGLPALAQQTAQVFEKQVPVKLNYLLALPKGYEDDSTKKWPLILFLHGAGERGSDVNRVKVHGPPKLVEAGKDMPFIVVSPQCPTGQSWRAFELNALLDEIVAKNRVDEDRIYLTGLSMGGFGTWDLASQYSSRFAAIAPICGGGNPTAARRMRDLPIWIFHGDADPTVSVQLSDDMVEAFKRLNVEVRYTRYPGVGHDSWTKTYNNPDLYEWFLTHRKSNRASGRPANAPAERR